MSRVMFLALLALIGCTEPPPGPGVAVAEGDLVATVRGNVRKGGKWYLSGVTTLSHARAPYWSAFDDERETRQAAGLNYEHLMSGNADGRNNKAPRAGPFNLSAEPDGSIVLTRPRDASPWETSATMRYRLVAPHYIDFEFRATIHDANQFASRGWALFFFASYMSDVADTEIHFRGIPSAGAAEAWVSSAPPAGNYVAEGADPLGFDSSDWALNIACPNEDWPRIAQPFYYGRAGAGMVYQVMFDKLHTATEDIRFAVARYKLDENPRPAWDFAYVVRGVTDGQVVGFRGRLVWKPWVSPADCLQEYQTWAAGLR